MMQIPITAQSGFQCFDLIEALSGIVCYCLSNRKKLQVSIHYFYASRYQCFCYRFRRQPPRWLFRFACLDLARFRALEVPSRSPPWRIREPDYPC